MDEVVDDRVELGPEAVPRPGEAGHGAVGQVAAEVPDEDGVAGPLELPGHHVVDGHEAAEEVHEREHVLQAELWTFAALRTPGAFIRALALTDAHRDGTRPRTITGGTAPRW